MALTLEFDAARLQYALLMSPWHVEPDFQLQILANLFFRNKGAYIVGRVVNGTRVTPIARVANQGFRYSIVFLLPLALLAFAGYFATALTRDPAPRSR